MSTLILYGVKSNVQWVTVDATSPTIGIVFSLIIVRIGLGLGAETTFRSEGTPNGTFRIPFTNRLSTTQNRDGTLQSRSQGQVPLRPLVVNVTETVDLKGDDGESLRSEAKTKVSIA